MESHVASGYTNQTAFDLRCEWGAEGITALAPAADVLVIVDVLSFTTCVSIAVERGASVLPYRFRDVSAEAYAAAQGAILAVPRGQTGATHPYSLSPKSLAALPARARLVLPSPNGATLATLAEDYGKPVLAGCLRNAAATAASAARLGKRIAVIPAGERWGRHEGMLRPAVEDWLGAGAILAALHVPWPAARLSPEASAAVAAFTAAKATISQGIYECASGRELREQGYAEDVTIAAVLDASTVAALLIEGAFVAR